MAATGGLNGTFSQETLPALGGGLALDVSYGINAVTLFVGGVLGDYNRNGSVDAADYTVWRNSLGQSGAGLAADGNFDGAITPLDFSVWSSHYGETAPAGVSNTTASVPEPSAGVLILFVVIVAFSVRRL